MCFTLVTFIPSNEQHGSNMTWDFRRKNLVLVFLFFKNLFPQAKIVTFVNPPEFFEGGFLDVDGLVTRVHKGLGLDPALSGVHRCGASGL